MNHIREENKAVTIIERGWLKRRRCWSPECTGHAIFRDWSGWEWCTFHFVKNAIADSELNLWWQVKKCRVVSPYIKVFKGVTYQTAQSNAGNLPNK